MKLSQELGLKPRQVKFWFQNRRTQMKVRMLASRHLMIPTSPSIPLHSFRFNGNPKINQRSSLHDSREKDRKRFVYLFTIVCACSEGKGPFFLTNINVLSPKRLIPCGMGSPSSLSLSFSHCCRIFIKFGSLIQSVTHKYMYSCGYLTLPAPVVVRRSKSLNTRLFRVKVFGVQ